MTRILVRKKEPFRLDERDMLLEIRDALNIPGITGVRIFNGYDVEGITNTEKAKHTVFSEAGQDIVYDEPDTGGAACIFAVASAAGQYDQREDYTVQLLKILEPQSEPVVWVFKFIALYGDILEADIAKIKEYYINPLEMREIPLSATKQQKYSEPGDVKIIKGFSSAGDELLIELAEKYSIAMILDDLKLCKEYFSKENRDPTITEMKVLDTYWSDHCRHSTFMTVIDSVSIDENKYTEGIKRARHLYDLAKSYVYGEDPRPLCLMDIATMEMKKLKKCGDLEDLEQSDEVNACSIEVTVPVDGKSTEMIVMFKNETHNHPTEMEPFGGASTCLGGAIRDPLSGRSHVFGAIRVTGSGNPGESIEDTLPGKLPQRKITQTAAKGYSSYGNGIGLPLGQLIEFYDPGFKAKRLECGAVVAAAKKADIIREKPKPGDIVVLLGGKTGRDGCGGATGSSKEQNDESLTKGGAEVQKGNPVIERNIVRLFRKSKVSQMIKKSNDFGAGGVCVAVGELADGLDIDLDIIPVKYPGLDGTELAISESQERMAVVINASDIDCFIEEAAKENLSAVKIADVTDTDHVVMKWRGEKILNISSDFLNSGGVRRSTEAFVTAPDWDFSNEKDTGKFLVKDNIKEVWLNNLADLNVCSKQGIAENFDSTAGGGTVFMPYGGIYQKTPEQGLVKRLPLTEGKTDTGILMSVGYNPKFGSKSPFHAAMYAVIESVMKITVMGGDYRKVRLSFQEYFEKLTNDKSWGKPYAALMGAFLAQDELGIPAIGGKDSMSGTFNEINVPPSLISFAVAVADTTKLVSRAFKDAGNSVYLLRTHVDDYGIPVFSKLKDNMGSINNLIRYGRVRSASVVGMGGIAAAVSEMTFGNRIGFKFDPEFNGELFAPQYTSVIIELNTVPKDIKNLRDDFILLGVTTETKTIDISGVSITLDEALEAWEGTLGCVFPIAQNPDPVKNTDSAFYPVAGRDSLTADAISQTPVSTAGGKRPRVVIPVFPGTTGEYEMEKQFRNAGADVFLPLFRNRTTGDIKESFDELARSIGDADILAIPSGLSAGGEPDGCAKLITMILRHKDIKEAVNKLTEEKKGLILGIGEGFKALLKTGLIQTGTVQDEENGEIVLAKNPNNRHHCVLKTVSIEPAESPWLKDMAGTLETVPVSGLDTAVHMSGESYNEYNKKGQIVSRYTGGTIRQGDSVTVAFEDSDTAPLSCSIEAMVSENGLILGRTGLVENLGKGLYTNVFEARESKIFTNAVQYICNL